MNLEAKYPLQCPERKESWNVLTAREKEVAEHLWNGRLNKEIADDMGISLKTVEAHRSEVMHKMEAGSVAELVRILALVEIG